MPYVLLLIVLAICVVSLRLRIRSMRRAQREIERRRSTRVSSYNAISTISVRIACDAAPAIEGIAKAYDSIASLDSARQNKKRRQRQSERSLTASRESRPTL